MKEDSFPFEIIESLTFSSRPHPQAATLRPLYRVALLALVLKLNCRSNTGSFLQLQFFNWLLKSPSLQEYMKTWQRSSQSSFPDIVHLDPMVNLALGYAIADELISVTTSSKYRLTTKGHDFANRIIEDDNEILREERQLLQQLGKQLSDATVRNKLL